MIVTIHDLMKQLDLQPIAKPALANSGAYYAHADAHTHALQAIATTSEVDGQRIAIPIDDALAMQFLSGAQDLTEWVVFVGDGKYLLKQREKQRISYNRLALTPIHQLQIIDCDGNDAMPKINGDVGIVLSRSERTVTIFYNEIVLKELSKLAKIYITREDDPSQLIASIEISYKLLDELKIKSGSRHWPNPIQITIDDVDDVSIFAHRTAVKIDILRIES